MLKALLVTIVTLLPAWVHAVTETVTPTPVATSTVTTSPTLTPVPVSPEVEAQLKTGDAFVSPDPASKQGSRIVFVSAETGQAKLSIYNAAGDPALLWEDSCIAGINSWDLDLSRFAAGVYLYQIELPENGSRKRGPLRKFRVKL